MTRLPKPADHRERALRAHAWRKWFEGWLAEPLEKRSTGFDALPGEYFDAIAGYISTELRLDPTRDVVLDVGCDSAMVTRRIAPSCRWLVGVDFVSGLLAAIPREAIRSTAGTAAFLAGDGRSLPFRSQAFTKVYCSGVIHVLPSLDDGMTMIEEILRVCRPGGEVLVTAVPDARKRIRVYAYAWRQAAPRGKLALVASVLTPRWLKRILRRLPGLGDQSHQVILYYPLHDVRRRLESRGLECQVLDFPSSFWSRDFRTTRSNLLIRLPARWHSGRLAEGR